MKNELILLLIEHKKAYNKRCKAECERIKKMVRTEKSAVKHATPEHFYYRIKRIYLKHSLYPTADRKSFYLINNRGNIKQKCAEYFVKIFYILEENFKRAENKSHTEAENKKNNNGNKRKENPGSDMRRFGGEKVEINNETNKNDERNQEGYKV